MKIKTQRKYIFKKAKPFHVNQATSRKIISMRLTSDTNIPQSQLSFDSFFYRDHVTLKKYQMQGLKQSSALKRHFTEQSTSQKWREQQQSQMVKLIESIDLWKNIKSNRNNILVYGNKIKCPQTSPTQKKITWNFDNEDQNSHIIQNSFGIERARTTDNPLISDKQKITQYRKSRSQKKSKSNQKQEQAAINSQNVGKLKRKMNFQIYKLNKQLLRDYLNQSRQYDLSYNHLIKDQDNLESKLKKITTLISVLKKQQKEKQNIVQLLTQKRIHPLQKNQNQNQFIEKDQQFHNKNSSHRVRTQICDTKNLQPVKSLVSLQKLKKSCQKIDDMQNDAIKKRNNTVNLMKKKSPLNFYKRQQCSQKVQKMFKNEWQKIEQQIKLKFRRQAQYSLNIHKKKRNDLFS